MGDAKRYYSRDVIRIGGERVAVDPILTPGEPGRYHQTQFEESIQEEMKTPFDQREKLKFVEQKPLVDEKEDALDGLKSYDEFALLQKEKKRRKELYKYHLSTVVMLLIIDSRRRLSRFWNLRELILLKRILMLFLQNFVICIPRLR